MFNALLRFLYHQKSMKTILIHSVVSGLANVSNNRRAIWLFFPALVGYVINDFKTLFSSQIQDIIAIMQALRPCCMAKAVPGKIKNPINI